MSKAQIPVQVTVTRVQKDVAEVVFKLTDGQVLKKESFRFQADDVISISGISMELKFDV